MSTMNQKISELVDAAADSPAQRDALDCVVGDAAACRVWQRYHLIGCVLRGEVQATGADLSARIRARLEVEETVMVSEVADGYRNRNRNRNRSNFADWLRGLLSPWQFAGGALAAASLAVVAVITLTLVGNEQSADTVVANNINNATEISIADNNDAINHQKLQQEVGEMLTQHGEFTSSPALNGLVVYAKFVSNEPVGR